MKDLQEYLDRIARGEDTVPEDIDVSSKTYDFIKFAKERYGHDITFEPSNIPDTFESIFGMSFIKEDKKMAINKITDNAFNKMYNVEWRYGNGKIQTTSAILTDISHGLLHFVYPNGGLFIIEKEALRSLQCIED